MMGRKAAPAAVALAILAAMWLGRGPALARAGGAGVKEEARSLLVRGDRYLARGDRLHRRGRRGRARRLYARALESYRKAYELVPKESLFFAIAGAEEKLRRYLDAVEHYQRVFDQVEHAALREQASARIRALSRHVAVLHLDVRPGGAEISVDRKLIGVAPLQRPIYLAGGEHVVTVTATGYSPFEATILLQEGQSERRTVELAEAPVLVKTPKPMNALVDAPKRRAAAPAPSRSGLIAGVALTAALAAGAATTGILALSKHRALHDETAGRSAEARASLADTGRTLARVTDGLVAGAILVGAYTTYRYFAIYRPRRVAYERARAPWGSLWILPHAHSRGGGLAVGGRF